MSEIPEPEEIATDEDVALPDPDERPAEADIADVLEGRTVVEGEEEEHERTD